MSRLNCLLALVVGLAFSWTGCAQHVVQDEPIVLNNLVTQLLKVEEIPAGTTATYTFTNPRNGWVFFGSTSQVTSQPKVTISLGGDVQPGLTVVHTSPTSQTLESMRFLPAGQHEITVRSEPGAGVKALVVRAVAELMYSQYGANPQVQEYGKFDLPYLKRHVFPNLNCMIFSGSRLDRDVLEAWRSEGKRSIQELYAKPYFDKEKKWTAEEAYEYWAGSVGMTHPLLDGIIVDEFGRNKDPKFQFILDSVKMVHADPKLNGRVYYPYCGTMYGGKMSEAFIKDIMEYGYKFAWERYLFEKPTRREAEEFLEGRLAKSAREWEKRIPGSVKHMIVCFGHMITAPPESVNSHANVDHKYYMDMQFNIIANDPAFHGLYGVMEYLSRYTDEEYFRWSMRLFRHYCIEGNTTMLSDEYGYTFSPDHLKNPDFDDGLKGWTVNAAEPGSITTASHKKYSWLQGRYPPTTQGDTFLLTKRSAEAPNTFSQVIRNLKVGELYCLKMYTGDYGDLKGDISNRQSHGVAWEVEDAERVGTLCLRHIFANCYSHHAGKFNREHKYWMNYHQLIFRAQGETARLVVRDWANPDKPSGPIGQQLMFNFFEVQPYFVE